MVEERVRRPRPPRTTKSMPANSLPYSDAQENCHSGEILYPQALLVVRFPRPHASAVRAKGTTPKRFQHTCKEGPSQTATPERLTPDVPLCSSLRVSGRHTVHVVPRIARPAPSLECGNSNNPVRCSIGQEVLLRYLHALTHSRVKAAGPTVRFT